MKTSSIVIGLWATIIVNVQAQVGNPTTGANPSAVPAPTEYQVVDRGANHRVWQRETYEQSPDGKIVTHVHSYSELATGLHYKDANTGQWVESKEEIETYPNGAIARQGQYQVIFANNLNSAGAIDMQTPDGKRLRSNILGLGYYDSSTGQSVLIAQLQDSQGELISANQVLYPNAFQGVKADVRYTYKKGSFEQDVILREQPPAPESLGLNPDTTEIQVMTEFIDPPQETIQERSLDKNGDLDQEVSWGAIRLGHGKAFDLGQEQNPQLKVPVQRQYSTVNGRKILFEIVPLDKVVADLQKLPRQASIKSKLPMTASNTRRLPKAPLAQAKSGPMKLAALPPSDKGYVLDYVELNTDQNDYTFQGDTTYFISDVVNFSGVVTFEGGTILKFNSTPSYMCLQMWGDIVCKTAPYHPAVFTALDDNTIGETIGSGSPVTYHEALAGSSTSTLVWHDLLIKYADYAIQGSGLQVSDCKFVNCLSPIFIEYGEGYATNLLMLNAGSAFYGTAYDITAYHLTIIGNTNTQLTTDWDSPGLSSVSLINSLLVNVGVDGDATITTNYTARFTDANLSAFQVVGGGNCYLATNSAYRNAGTTNIGAALLAELSTKTTYPPVVYSNATISVPTTLSPQAQRDADQPDLGYHYDPLDYVFGRCTVSSNLLFTAGTAVGYFNDPSANSALLVGDSATVAFNGTASAPCRWTVWDTVQEGGNDNWQVNYALGGIVGKSYVTTAPAIRANFTICSALANEVNFFRDNGTLLTLCATNCEFWTGNIGGYYASYNLVNCLTVNSQVGLWWNYNSANLNMQDCTMVNGYLFADHNHSGNWPVTIQNCAFDQTTFYLNPHAYSTNGAYCDYNAFATNASRLYFLGAHDVIVTPGFNWQTSWFGNYYLPTNSLLTNVGSTNADSLALYHFTTQPDQTKETNSIVDIGYHYVATDGYGNPLDTDADGMADYLEDVNGNGVYDGGDPWNWQVPDVDADNDGLPDWWEWYWFGNYSHTGDELDASGNTLLSDYTNGTDPNQIQFSIQVANNYVSTSYPTLQLNVSGGVPSDLVVLVDSTNFATTNWTAYTSSSITVNLGSTQGWHELWVGLKGLPADAAQSWQWKRLKLDTTPPQLTLTSPVTNTVDVPVIQLAGYSPEKLGSISYDLTNATGVVTNQQILILDQHYDTTAWEFTTNTFQGFDLPLTNGVNTFTLHATDLAGNVTTTNFSFTLDYSNKPPVTIQSLWPQDGMKVCGSSFVWNGTVSDPTATVSAQTVLTNGSTNFFTGRVGRDGKFWLKDLPLSSGTNIFTLTATDVANNVTTTNLTVIQGDAGLTIDPITPNQTTVTGGIGSTNFTIWVNGIQATITGNTWEADHVPIPPNSSLVQVTAIPNGGGQ